MWAVEAPSSRGATCLPLTQAGAPDKTSFVFESLNGQVLYLSANHKYRISYRYTFGTVSGVPSSLSVSDFNIEISGDATVGFVPVFANLAKWYSWSNFIVLDIEGYVTTLSTPAAIKISCPALDAATDGTPLASLVVYRTDVGSLPIEDGPPEFGGSFDDVYTPLDMTQFAEQSTGPLTQGVAIVREYSGSWSNPSRDSNIPIFLSTPPSSIPFKEVRTDDGINTTWQNTSGETWQIAISGKWDYESASVAANAGPEFYELAGGATAKGYMGWFGDHQLTKFANFVLTIPSGGSARIRDMFQINMIASGHYAAAPLSASGWTGTGL